MTSRPARARLALLLTVCTVTSLLALAVPGASAAESPRGSTYSEVYFPSGDGTMLHGELLLPEGGCETVTNADGSVGCPTVVSVGPYFGSGVQNGAALGFGDLSHSGVSARFFDFITYEFDADPETGVGTNIFEMGYAWLQVDSRGYGSSGGCNDYGGHGEQMDVEAAINWVADQSWSNGKVGMWGKSYDGWTQVMGLAENPAALEAVVIQAPLIERYGIGYVNGVHHDSGWYVTTNLYALYDYTPPAPLSGETTPEEVVYPLTGSATDPCWAEQNVQVLNPDHSSPYWQEGDLRPRAGRNDDVAVFWVHGFTDVNTKPDQIFGVYDGLMEVNADKTRAWFGQWNHVRGTDVRDGAFVSDRPDEAFVVGRAGFNEEALDWLDHYLRGEDFEYAANEQNVVEVQDNVGAWRTEHTYPAPDTLWTTFPLNAGTYTDDLGDDPSTGFWTVSPEVEQATRIAGESIVTIDAQITVPGANFVGVLYDLAPGGRAEEIGRSAYRLTESGEVTFRTQPGDWLLEPGHRLAFHVTAGHPEYFPYPTQQEVTISGGSITVPFLEFERQTNLSGVQTSARTLYAVNGVDDSVDLEAATNPAWEIPAPLAAPGGRIAVAGHPLVGELVQPDSTQQDFAPDRPESIEEE